MKEDSLEEQGTRNQLAEKKIYKPWDNQSVNLPLKLAACTPFYIII